MVKRIISRMFFESTLVVMLFVSACGSESSDTPAPLDVIISKFEAIDYGNSSGSSDLRVSISLRQEYNIINLYRLVAIKADEEIPDLEQVISLSERDLYHEESYTGQTSSFHLKEDLRDFDGDQIVEGTNYLLILAPILEQDLGTVRELAISNPVTLAQENILEIVAELPIGTGGLEVDSNGNIYCADFGGTLGANPPGQTLYKVSPNGNVTSFVRGLTGGTGNVIGPDGAIYQSSIVSGQVHRISLNGDIETYVDGLRGPVGLVFDDEENLYAAMCHSNTIEKIAPDGSITIFAEGPLLQCPTGMTIDEEQNIYFTSFRNGFVGKITPDGTMSSLVAIPGGNNGHLLYFQGYLYVVGRASNQIFKVDLEGNYEVVVGSGNRGHRQGSVRQAQLSLPNDIGFSADGLYMYINDYHPTGGTPFNTAVTPSYLKRVKMEIE